MTEDNGARTKALVVVFTRPSDFSQEASWSAWYDEEHLPSTAAASGAWVVSRWETIDRPPGGSGPVGFVDMAIYELEDAAIAPQLLDVLDGPRKPLGPVHVAHTIIGVDVFDTFGRWSTKTEPHAGLTGQVMAYVGPNDAAREAEWNAWYDAVHVVDMMESGAFSNTTRGRRVSPQRFGPNFLTLYDVTLPTVEEAVQRSGAAMGPAHAAGRILDCHTGGLRAALKPTGIHGAQGYRP